MSDPAIIAIIVGIVICGSAWGWLQLAKQGLVKSNPTLDKILGLVAFPLGILVTVLGAVALSKKALGGAKKPMEGDDDLAPDEDEDTDHGEPRETEAEHVRRVIEEAAEEVETHVREEAPDDEVAARGAAIFDPGAPPSDDEGQPS
jgi:hypothetical protein